MKGHPFCVARALRTICFQHTNHKNSEAMRVALLLLAIMGSTKACDPPAGCPLYASIRQPSVSAANFNVSEITGTWSSHSARCRIDPDARPRFVRAFWLEIEHCDDPLGNRSDRISPPVSLLQSIRSLDWLAKGI